MSASGRVLGSINDTVNSNQAASGGTLGGAIVPALRFSGTAAINKVSMSQPLASATGSPRVRFQLDSNVSSESPSGTDDSQSAADVRSPLCAKAIAVPSSLAGNKGADSDVGPSRSLCEARSKTDVPSNGQQAAGKDFSSKLTSAADDVAGTSTMSRVTPNMGSADADDTKNAQVSMSIIEVGGACTAQTVHQEHSVGREDRAGHLSEQDYIAPMMNSIRRRIKVAEFQFAYAGYAARLALKHSA